MNTFNSEIISSTVTGRSWISHPTMKREWSSNIEIEYCSGSVEIFFISISHMLFGCFLSKCLHTLRSTLPDLIILNFTKTRYTVMCDTFPNCIAIFFAA